MLLSISRWCLPIVQNHLETTPTSAALETPHAGHGCWLGEKAIAGVGTMGIRAMSSCNLLCLLG